MNPRFLCGAIATAFVAVALFGPAIGQEGRKPPKSSSFVVADRGRVVLAEDAVLAADRPGILEFVEPEEGSQISAGQKVAGLKDEVAVAALEVAEATAKNDIEVRYAQKAAAVAEAEYAKALQANRRFKDTIPEVEIERLKLSVERAKLQIEKAALDQEVARLQAKEKAAELATYQIVCPIDGLVTRVHKDAGEAVQQGDPILEVVRTDIVRVEGFVNVAEVFRIKAGDSVRVRLDLPQAPPEVREQVFEGKIGFVDVTANPVSNQVRVWAEVPNEGNLLRAGLPALMDIAPAGETAAAPARDKRE